MKMNEVIGEIGYDNLFAGTTVPVNQKSVQIKSGQGVLLRGTVLAIETATGLAVKVDSTKTGGIETADCILTDDVDTTTSVASTAYSSGLFNRNALIFGGADTTANHEKTLRTLGIYLSENL